MQYFSLQSETFFSDQRELRERGETRRLSSAAVEMFQLEDELK